MTDKELKEKVADIIMEAIEEYNNNEPNRPMIASLYAGKIISIINSLPEEPVSSVWHGMSEDAENGRNIIIIDPKGFYGAVLRKGGSQLRNYNKERYVKWAYIDDVVNLSNVQRIVKNLKEPVSEELGEIVLEGTNFNKSWYAHPELAFKAGAEWLKNNLWKPADGDDLPIIDREVIALLDNGKVVFAHRPPEYWDGKNIVTGKVTRNYPKTYDKGGWNIPNVKWWLDVYKLPNVEE